MDITDVRIGVTLISFAAFIGITAWTWSRRNKADFDEASGLPLPRRITRKKTIMTDFVSGFWAWYVTVIVMVSIIYCVWGVVEQR